MERSCLLKGKQAITPAVWVQVLAGPLSLSHVRYLWLLESLVLGALHASVSLSSVFAHCLSISLSLSGLRPILQVLKKFGTHSVASSSQKQKEFSSKFIAMTLALNCLTLINNSY
jgi:hypothetical protein